MWRDIIRGVISDRGIAKLVRHGILNPACVGSSPATPAIYFANNFREQKKPTAEKVAGFLLQIFFKVVRRICFCLQFPGKTADKARKEHLPAGLN